MGKFKGKKTYIIGALGILGAIASYLVGDATIMQASQMIITAVLGMTVRSAISG